MIRKIISKNIWWLVFLAVFLIGSWVQFNKATFATRINWVDDMYWVTRWEKVLDGQLPYRDFHEEYGPLFMLLGAPLYQILGRDLAAARFLQFELLGAVGILVLVLTIKSLGIKGWRGVVSIFFLLGIFEGWLWFFPARIWWGMGVLLVLNIVLSRKSFKGMILAGLVTVGVGLYSIEQGVFALVTGFVGVLVWSQKERWRFLWGYLAGAAAMILLSVAVMGWTGMLTEYLKTNFRETATLQNAAYGLPFPAFNLENPWSYVWYFPFVLLAFVGCYWFLKWRRGDEEASGGRKGIPPLVPMFLVFGALSLKVYLGRTEVGHLATDNAPIWILGVATWFDWLTRWKQKNGFWKVILTIVFFAALIVASGVVMNRGNGFWKKYLLWAIWPPKASWSLVYLPEARTWVSPQDVAEIRGVAGFVAQNISRSEEVYPFPVASGMSLFIGRTVPNYYEQATFAPTSEDQRRIIGEVEKRKVPWVIYSRKDYVIPLARMTDVYIWETFKPVANFGDFLIMKRIKSWDLGNLTNFLEAGDRVGELRPVAGIEKAGRAWKITSSEPEWEVAVSPVKSGYSTLVLRYRLGFLPGLANLSKTALGLSWEEDGQTGKLTYQSPFLFPGGWRESWLELPRVMHPEKLHLKLFWPGGLNPRAVSVEWGEILLR